MIETFKWMHSIYPLLTDDFNKIPTKPTVLGEGAYELGAYGKDCDSITPQRVRIQGYHAFFAGAAGYTFGNWAIWPFRGKHLDAVWEESLNTPGSVQVGQVMKKIITEIGIFSFHPDQSLIRSENINSDFRQCAMIKNDKTKIIAYFPERVAATIDFSKLDNQNNLKCFWIDPRNGNKEQGWNL